MSKKPNAESQPARPASPRARASKARPSVLSMFTPLNVILLTLLLGGAAAIAFTQFEPTTPTRPTPAPAPITPPAPTPPSASKPPPAPSPEDRMSLLAPLAKAANPTAWEGIAVGSHLPLFATDPPRLGLAPAPQGVRSPINAVDLFTSKATNFSSPTVEYKGYKIAFCCANSAGYNGAWEGLTEAEKDTYVRSFLK